MNTLFLQSNHNNSLAVYRPLNSGFMLKVKKKKKKEDAGLLT